MQKINQKYINAIVKKALLEDLSPKGDITTNLISFKNKIIKAKLISKQSGVISGLDFCKAAFKLAGKEAVFKPKIKDGEKIGIVGNIGSGKTSLIRNLIGFHVPEKGTINIGGYEIKNIPAKQLRNFIGYCPQKIQLFSGTIFENIAAGLDDASEEEVINAAQLSCAHDFITQLPGGYSYQLISGGSNLSGGQRQSIAIARAIVRKPKILVLDEPTSHMDGGTENRVINNLMSLDYKPTIILSTHRTNHLLMVDNIGVLIDGQLVQYGPKDQIIKRNENEN